MINALINKIIDHSVVDGLGNRTVIFFQGCNLNCHYCHNPETIQLCRHCGICVEHCPQKALTIIDQKVHYDPRLCINCDTCIKVCPYNSSPKVRSMTSVEVFDYIKNNTPFIRGVTLSGGECTKNPDFIKELFKLVKTLNLSTMMDSNGTYDFESDPDILKDCDSVMLDIKTFDASDHKKLTDHDNDIIIQNALYLAKQSKLTEIRTVIIPNAMDPVYTVKKISETLSPYIKQNEMTYKLIKYRTFGVRKQYLDFEEPTADLMDQLQEIAASFGFKKIIVI